MKLNNKILLLNLVLSAAVLVITGIAMYYLVFNTVYDELDNHLLQHKTDIIEQVQAEPSSIKDIQKLGGLGSYEWVEIEEIDPSAVPIGNSYATVDTTRNEYDSGPEAYRRLSTQITVANTTYSLKIYEEVAAWENISITILLSVLAGLLIWILLLYLINQIAFERTLKPFYDTVDKLETISKPSDFVQKFPESSTYEISVLNEALNTMMLQISSTFEEQKKFIQNASHELLTPLSIIRQKSEKILSQADELDETTLKSAHDIHQTAVRLTRLSNSLLLISRVENKQYDIEEEVHINDVVGDVLDEMQDFISMKNIKVSIKEDTDAEIRGNKELIHSAIYNIVQNAVKFSPKNSTLQIWIGSGSGRYELEVSDEGPGISNDLKRSIFDRFKKSNGHTNKLGSNSGTGLGLSIVKSICTLHGFDYQFESPNGSGTKVTLWF